MNLLIVLQSHSITDSQKILGYIEKNKLRYTGTEKHEVSRRCIWSLVDSINYLISKRSEIDVKLVVIDDHSSDDFLGKLNHIVSLANCPTEIINLETYGINESLKACYLYGKEHGKDFVYFAQDDYLYEETCLEEMLDVYFQVTSKNVAKSVCVYPYNDPYRYIDDNVVPVRIIQGMKRHWRTSYQTACCFMVNYKTLCNEWDLFEAFYEHPVDEKMEDDTINKLFQERNYILLTPIPSLALHMQYETEKDPYINWVESWSRYNNDIIELPERVVLNIGSGNKKLNFPCFNDFKEITLDIDSEVNPDLVGDITKLKSFKNNSIDILFASHVLEHVYTHEVIDVLQNANRIIKDNGMALFIVPNLKHIASKVQSGNLDEPIYESELGPISALDMIYGSAIEVARGKSYMSHKTGFTDEILKRLFDNLGLTGFFLEAETNLFILLTKKSIQELSVDPQLILRDFYAS